MFPNALFKMIAITCVWSYPIMDPTIKLVIAVFYNLVIGQVRSGQVSFAITDIFSKSNEFFLILYIDIRLHLINIIIFFSYFVVTRATIEIYCAGQEQSIRIIIFLCERNIPNDSNRLRINNNILILQIFSILILTTRRKFREILLLFCSIIDIFLGN